MADTSIAATNVDSVDIVPEKINTNTAEIQAKTWADAHLPELQPGEYYCWSKRVMDSNRPDWDKKEYPFINQFCQSRDELITQVLRETQDVDTDVFVVPATFTRKERKNAFVSRRRTIVFDFDVTNPGDAPEKAAKKYSDLNAAAGAAFELCARLGVRMTFVKSGRGVHCYTMLDRDYQASEVKPVADKIKQWALDSGFKIDVSVTGDMSRLIRMPGSFWRKNKSGLKVVPGDTGTAVSLDELKELVSAASDPDKPEEQILDRKQVEGLDALTRNLMGYDSPLDVGSNRKAITSLTDFLIARRIQDESYSAWWEAVKDYAREAQREDISEEDEAFLHGEARRLSEASVHWDEAEFEKKWNDPGIEHGRIKNLFRRAQDMGWINPGPDRPATALDSDERIEQLRTLGSDRLVARLGDVIAAMSCPDIAGVRLAYDAFTGPSISEIDEDTWRALNDADSIELRVRLENQCFRSVNGQMARDALTGVMGRNQIDTAQLWAGKLPEWDGVPRVDGFMSTHFGAASNEYSKSVSHYLFTALAGRLLEPGCKADMVPILVGPQGGRKSTGVMSLCPSPDAFAELNFHKADDDAKRLLRGRLIVEIAELAGMGKKDSETLKQFLSARFDMWRPTYHEGMARYERRCIFIGTSNRDDFLKDPTGHRRFLPIKVGKVDVEAILRDRDQLWAEGFHLFKKHGVLFTDAEELAKDEHEEFEQSNPLAERIERVLKQPAPMEMSCMWDRTYLKLDDVMTLLDIPPRDMARMQPEVCNALRALGYEKAKRRWEIGEKPVWRWVRQVEAA